MTLRIWPKVRPLFSLLLLLFSSWLPIANASSPKLVYPYEKNDPGTPLNAIDSLIMQNLQAQGFQPAALCSDEVFVRRVYFDLIGTLPESRAVQAFLDDHRPEKRAVLIEELMKRDEFADYWSMKWCDLLRVKAEFPINLWPNAVQAYHRWVHKAMRDNMPMDQFARELLTSSGSNFRVGPVNFYRAVQGRSPEVIAGAVALTFLGTRLEKWPPESRKGFEAFFSRIAYKGTGEWKEEIVCLDPASTTTLHAAYPDGTAVDIPVGQDPRKVFADWLLAPDNPCLSRNMANRIWFWLMGRGIIHEPDDIRPDNPPSNPELLAFLEEELAKAKYDQRHLFRLILNSRTYQQSSIPRSDNPQTESLFGCYAVRRLDAEVLIDALCFLGGAGENYESPIPEPFTYIPNNQRTIALADASITSQFLEMFGRPARDTGLQTERNNQVTDAQRLHLLNSTHVQKKIEDSWRLKALPKQARGNRENLIRLLYVSVLSRHPVPEEISAAQAYQKKLNLKDEQFVTDLAWALINSKEFLCRH